MFLLHVYIFSALNLKLFVQFVCVFQIIMGCCPYSLLSMSATH